jgi:hypothetical protein
MTTDVNPYEAPSAEVLDTAVEPPTRRRRICVRYIPATFCGVLGLMFILGAVLMACVLFRLAAMTGRIDGVAFDPGRDARGRAVENIAMVVLPMAAGWGWLYTAREWVRGRWWTATMFTLGMYVLLVMGDALRGIL